jgi:hypothetical protein
MNFQDIKKRAIAVRKLYAEHEMKKYGRHWTDEEIALGLVGDTGDFMKLILAKNNIRAISDADK